MTSAKITYPSPSDSVPTWWQEINKLMESKILNNSESSVKSDPAVKANVSSDSHKRKLQVALQRFLDYGKEREILRHLIREFGDHAKSRKTDKSSNIERYRVLTAQEHRSFIWKKLTLIARSDIRSVSHRT